jgi:hypothetical protein
MLIVADRLLDTESRCSVLNRGAFWPD